MVSRYGKALMVAGAAVAAVVLVGPGFHGGRAPAGVPGGGPVHLAVRVGTNTILDVEDAAQAQGASAFALLEEAALANGVVFDAKNYPGMGRLVTRIGDFRNGTGGDYWQYFVNGDYMTVGSDAYIPVAGDSIVWEFIGDKER